MSDEIDLSVAIADRELERRIAAARAPVPAGEPGECEGCDEHSERLVGGYCARCRDRSRRGCWR